MRERTLRVDTDKLIALSTIHRPKKVAETLQISKQRWHNYQKGENDMPESILNRLCAEFNIERDDLILQP